MLIRHECQQNTLILFLQSVFTIFFLHFLDGWTTDDLVFLWKEGDPVQVVKNLHLPRFTLEKFLTDYCNSKTNTGCVFYSFQVNSFVFFYLSFI